MFRRLLPLVVISISILGGFSKQSEPTVVLTGQVAILPCQNDDPVFVEWSRENLDPNVVLLYREGKEEHRMKNKAFRYRTSLVRPELDSSDKSLRIANVQLSDEGNYTCMSGLNGDVQVVTTVWLSVVTVSSPKLTLVTSANGATVQCAVRSSSSELKMDFVDNEGNVLPSDEPRFHLEDTVFFNVTRKMLVPDNITSITCRVTQTQTNQTWIQTLAVPDYCKASYTQYILGIIGIIGLTCACVVIIIIIITMAVLKCCKYGDDQHSSKESLQSSASSPNVPSDSRPLMDDTDGSKVKVHPQTGDVAYRTQQGKTPQPSAAVCQQPAQPEAAAASSSASSNANNTLKRGRFSQTPIPKPVDEKLLPKPDTRFHKNPGKIKRTMSDCSGISRPSIPTYHGQYLTVHHGNRFALLFEENSDVE